MSDDEKQETAGLVAEISAAVDHLATAFEALDRLELEKRMRILDALDETVFGKYREGVVDRLARIEGSVQTMLHHSTIKKDGITVNVDNQQGSRMADNRNQSVNAGRDAAAHGGQVSINGQSVLIAIAVVAIVALAVAFGASFKGSAGGSHIEITPQQEAGE